MQSWNQHSEQSDSAVLSNNQPTLTSKLLTYYFLFFGLMAIATLFVVAVVDADIDNHMQDGTLLNLAGKQAAIVEDITKLAVLLAEVPDSSSSTVLYARELNQILAIWQKQQEALRYRKGDSLAGENSPQVRKLFENIEPSHQLILFAGFRLTNHYLRRTVLPSQQVKRLTAEIVHAEPIFFQGITTIADRYSVENKERLNRLFWIVIFIGTGFLLTFLFTGLFIFRPLVIRLNQSVEENRTTASKLTESYSQIATQNQEL
ncbi:MAG: hypothetical protein NZ108_09240, partial [Bacteroidia bacterium]|nr:hypothetical protein [Bacteroidia bacterium]